MQQPKTEGVECTLRKELVETYLQQITDTAVQWEPPTKESKGNLLILASNSKEDQLGWEASPPSAFQSVSVSYISPKVLLVACLFTKETRKM